MSAQMSEDNIFLRAALKGEFIQPSTSGSDTPNKKGKKKQPEKKIFHRYSQMEWRSVVTFMKKHAEVLTENSEIYISADPNDKKLQERLRKRAARILKGHDSTAK